MFKAQTRMTKQRKIILEELSGVYTHPTADEVYSMVRERLPHISLGTVYRNLDLLAESKQILKLENAGSTRRYDANITPHSHVRCISCGGIGDISSVDIPQVIPNSLLDNGYTLLSVRVEYDGVCLKCKHASLPTSMPNSVSTAPILPNNSSMLEQNM